jgi:hypothetical protein
MPNTLVVMQYSDGLRTELPKVYLNQQDELPELMAALREGSHEAWLFALEADTSGSVHNVFHGVPLKAVGHVEPGKLIEYIGKRVAWMLGEAQSLPALEADYRLLTQHITEAMLARRETLKRWEKQLAELRKDPRVEVVDVRVPTIEATGAPAPAAEETGVLKREPDVL